MDLSIAQRVMERIDLLATFSEEPDRLTRRYGTAALRQTQDQVAEWMQTAGMTVRRDAIGNLIGRYEAEQAGAKTLLLGSHLDSVRDAGRYDGPLGVMVALAAVERLHARGARLPFVIEVIAFADEEGLRFGTTYLASWAVAGTFPPDLLRRTDADGIALADAIRSFGGDPDALDQARYASADLLGYCEVHIEQGPLLESLDLPVGIVTAIQGQSRCTVDFLGEAGHAGTVPLNLRHDALCAAAEFVLAVETLAHAQSGLVATVGQMTVEPGASNVIPGRAMLSLDLRHPDDVQREQAYRRLYVQAESICAKREVTLDWQHLKHTGAVQCSPMLAGLLAQAVAAVGYPVHYLPSGAGHDAGALSAITPVAMLFVRCMGGISHNPAESVTTEDVAVAIDVLGRFLELVAAKRDEL